MANSIYDVERYRSGIGNWWLALIMGIVFLVVGIMVFMKPGETYMALSIVFGIMVVVSGIIEIYVGSKMPAHAGKGWLIAAGIIELLIGILLIAIPTTLLTILPFILGFWLMFRGFTTIGVASDMMGQGIGGAGWTMFFAILLIIFAFMVLANPIIGVGALVIWLGLSLVFAGIALVAFAFHLNKLKKHLQ